MSALTPHPSTLPPALWLDLLGLPWQADARGPQAYDCLGLLLEIQRRMGHIVPDWTSRESELDAAKSLWRPVTEPEPGVAILIHGATPRWHIGVVTGGGYMLHASQHHGAVVRERYTAFPWHKRIEGFYSWKQD